MMATERPPLRQRPATVCAAVPVPITTTSNACSMALPTSSGAAAFRAFSARARLLDGRTGNRAEGAEDAAIAGMGPQHRAAVLAIIEELAGVRRHGLFLPM